MKKTASALLILFAVLFGMGCEEKWVVITPMFNSGDFEPGAQKRVVLAEELTGVRCPNCPEGTNALVALDKQHGDRLVVVAIHAALGYTLPYANSQDDFRTAKGTELANYVGAAFFFPTAAINRRIVPPETEPYLPRQQWSGIIDEELAKPLEIAISLKTNYDEASRKLDISADLTPLQELSGEHRITVMIAQDSIVDFQQVNLVLEPNYLHRHVLRSILTSGTGDVITEALTTNNTVTKTFSTTLPTKWVDRHCSVIAFVHRGGNPNKEVLQAAEKYILK